MIAAVAVLGLVMTAIAVSAGEWLLRRGRESSPEVLRHVFRDVSVFLMGAVVCAIPVALGGTVLILVPLLGGTLMLLLGCHGAVTWLWVVGTRQQASACLERQQSFGNVEECRGVCP